MASIPTSCSAVTKSLASDLSGVGASSGTVTAKSDAPELLFTELSSADQPGIAQRVASNSPAYVHVSSSPLTMVMGNRISIPSHLDNECRIRSCCAWLICRSAIFRSVFAARLSASAALCRASAKCDSASAACVLADAISFSKESASCRAPRARVVAVDAAMFAFPALSIASPDLVSASLESVTALAAFWEASFALASRELICWPDRVSFRCPYGYDAISARTAKAKKTMPILPILSNRLSVFLSSDKWANASQTTSNAKNTSAAASRSLWARLTESSEFQSGRQVAKCVIVACIFIAAFMSQLFHYQKLTWRCGRGVSRPMYSEISAHWPNHTLPE